MGMAELEHRRSYWYQGSGYEKLTELRGLVEEAYPSVELPYTEQAVYARITELLEYIDANAPEPDPGFTIVRSTFVPELMEGTPNYGYNGVVGDYTPLPDPQMDYFGSFGPDFFNMRTSDGLPFAGAGDHVLISCPAFGWAKKNFPWSGTNNRYQGVAGTGGFQELLKSLEGLPITIDMYIPD